MNWQLIIVGLLVGLALAYLARTIWRTWRLSKAGGCGSCGCKDKTASPAKADEVVLIPSEQLKIRPRATR